MGLNVWQLGRVFGSHDFNLDEAYDGPELFLFFYSSTFANKGSLFA